MWDISKFKCPYIDKIDIWKTADIFREQHWPKGILPIDVESIVEKRLKLNIEPIHGLQHIDIDAYLRRDLSGIVVDYVYYMEDRFTNRLRFIYAHELGHLVLHKDFYSKFPIENLEDWKDFTLTVPDREYGYVEYQANEFAGRLLVPRESLMIELRKCIVQVEEMGLAKYLTNDPDSVLARISPALSRPFGVSNQVIELRVKREGVWPPEKNT